MLKSKSAVEKELKKLISRLHQEIFGKGPDGIWVKLNHNVGTYYVSKTLTNMEEFLLSVPGGEAEVVHLRKTIMENIKPRVCSEIELACGVTVLSIAIELSISTNAFFGAILFKENFD